MGLCPKISDSRSSRGSRRTKTVTTDFWEEKPYIFHLGNPTPDGENRYAQRRGRQDLFSVPETWAQLVEGLALEPPFPPQEGQKTDSG